MATNKHLAVVGQMNLMAGHRCPKEIGASLTTGFVVGSDHK